MTVLRIAVVTFWLGYASIATGQAVPPQIPTFSSSVSSFPLGPIAPSRHVQTRMESGPLEVITETIQVPGPDGQFKTFSETVTETEGAGSDSVHTKHEVFGTDADGHKKLIQTAESHQETLSHGLVRTTENIWTVDLNGHLQLVERQVEETKTLTSNVKQTDVSIYRLGIDDAVREQERVQQTERRPSPDFIQNEITRLALDSNGRWQTIEMRNQEIRQTGTNDSVEEEIVRGPDMNNVLQQTERKVTRRSTHNGQDEVSIEGYSAVIAGSVGSPLEVNERIHIKTITTPDGGRQSIQELERRSVLAPETFQMIQRTLETVRAAGVDRWEIQRRVFAPDGNGRFVLVVDENGQTTNK